MKMKNESIPGLVSVIIPCYNDEPYLEKCLRSVMDQDYREVEIIVVDDGSTDGCWGICSRIAKEAGQVKPFRVPHGGVSAARNYGIRQMSGEYVIFVDADDALLPGSISRLVRAANNHGADCATGKFLITIRRPLEQIDTTLGEESIATEHTFLHVAGYLFRREILEDMVEFPEGIKYSEDFYWGNMLRAFVKKYVLIDQFLYVYYISEDQVMHKVRKSNEVYVDAQRRLLAHVDGEIKLFNQEEQLDVILGQLISVRRLVMNATYGECFERGMKCCGLHEGIEFGVPLKRLFAAKLSVKRTIMEMIVRFFPILESYRAFYMIMKIKKKLH